MADKLLKYIPKTLQEDFVDNKVVPFIGAGFSKNAIMLDGTDILDWNGLGRAMAAYIPNYDYTNAIDALSLFESEFSRTKLIEVTKEDKENLQRAKEYLNVRNQVVHTEIKIKEKKAVEIVNCITSLCEAINNDRIIIL